jgi:hypothetical protein
MAVGIREFTVMTGLIRDSRRENLNGNCPRLRGCNGARNKLSGGSLVHAGLEAKLIERG